MSLFSLIGNLGAIKAADVGKGLLTAYAGIDPTGMSQAQMLEWRQHLAAKAAAAAHAETEAQGDETIVAEIQKNADRYAAAASKLDGDSVTATDLSVKKQLQDAGQKAADQAISLSQQLTSAKSNASKSRTFADEMRASVDTEADQLSSAENNLKQAVRDQEQAARDAETAKRRQSEREAAMGLTSSVSGPDAAINALKAKTVKLQEQTAAANMTTGAFSKGADTDKAVAAALHAVDTGNTSDHVMTIAEKLAAMKH